jgi:hypothetical protein
MDDFIRGLGALKKLLPQEALFEFETLEARMLENIHRERLYGRTGDTAADRYAIVDSLNQLAWKYKVKSFTDLCFHTQPIQVSSSEPSFTSGEVSNHETQQDPRVVVPPRIEVKFPTPIIPTVYYHLLTAQDFPLCRIMIDNSDPYGDDISLFISAFIEDYSDLAKTTVAVAKGEHKEATLLPILKHSALATLNDTRKVTLHVSVRQIFPTTREIHDEMMHVYLTAKDLALMGIRGEDQRAIDLTRYLAAWVTPNRPEIARVLHDASNYHPDKELNGYQHEETLAESAKSVREQARAIFAILKYKTELTYAHSPLNWKIDPGWVSQIVRLPSDCLSQGGIANCLESTLLFASLLERIGIEPILVIAQSHAFVGWRIEQKIDQYEFLDASMIGNNNFEQAQTYASELYKAIVAKDLERDIFYKHGFARVIDVIHYRLEGIYPLE